MQKRVLLTDLEKSKILRKPLNVQDGKEDGHQGGRRYSINDPGYLILKKWVEIQPEVQKPAVTAARTGEEEKGRQGEGEKQKPDEAVKR